MPWGGHPQGAPLPFVFSRRYALGRAPTRGAPTICLLSAFCPGEGANKGRPYQLSSLGEMPWGGHPQGAPLPIVFSRRFALGRAPTRGAPTICLLSALCPGEGTHKGRPYHLSSLGVLPWGGRQQGALLLGEMPWGGHPQGAPLPFVFSRRYALRRAPTRGAPTRFRQPHVGLSQFDAIALLLARSKNSDATIFYQCQHERRRGQESAEPVNLFCKPAAISRPAKLGVLR